MADDPKYEDGRLFDTGDMIGDMEVTAVSYQEDENGKKFNFVYHTQHPDDIVKAPEHGQELTTEDVHAMREASQQSDAEETPADEPTA